MTAQGRSFRWGFAAILAFFPLIACGFAEELPEPAHELPEGFCYVHEVIPDVILDIRYAGTHNFVGDPIDGYEAPFAILTNEAADKLKEAADEFRALGYRIMIFDAYRPQSAVRHFVRWSRWLTTRGCGRNSTLSLKRRACWWIWATSPATPPTAGAAPLI